MCAKKLSVSIDERFQIRDRTLVCATGREAAGRADARTRRRGRADAAPRGRGRADLLDNNNSGTTLMKIVFTDVGIREGLSDYLHLF